MGFMRSGCHATRSDCTSVPENNCSPEGNKFTLRMFYHVGVSGVDLQPASFEELAIPLFDQLYNFAHWLTQNREEAEDLVQETYAKALKGFSSFQLGTNFRAWMYRILRNTFLTSRTGLRATRQKRFCLTARTANCFGARSMSSRCISGRSSFFVTWRSCRIRKFRKRFRFL